MKTNFRRSLKLLTACSTSLNFGFSYLNSYAHMLLLILWGRNRMASHCEPGYLSVVRLVCDFTNTGTECYFQVLVWSIMVTEVELPYTLNTVSPHWKLCSHASRFYLLGKVPCYWLD